MGDGAPRMEVAHVEQIEPMFAASGTQLGATYELRYRLEPEVLHLELVGERTVELGLDGADFFDLGWSPLFNSLPVIRDGLLESGPARDYRMRWVDVPSLQVMTPNSATRRWEMVSFASRRVTLSATSRSTARALS